MRKLIITGMAIAMLAVPAAAMASVNVNDSGVGFVGKGDVQIALGGISNQELQTKWKADQIKFTGRTSSSTETRWSCNDGSTNSRTSKVIQATKFDVTANLNPQGNVADGFNILGHGSNIGGSFVSGGYTGAPYVGYCASGWSTGFLDPVFDNNVVIPGLYVNGVALPNTPIAPVV
jgi:hypothetical protein